MSVIIRPVIQADLPALLAIYNHYIETSVITFDLEPKTLEQRQSWLDSFHPTGRHQCFVAVKDSTPIGWSCSGKFRDKAAYDTTVETSIYLAPGEQGQGLGRKLYDRLFEALAKEDVHQLIGGLTVPNEPSVRLHLACGFQKLGQFHEVGRKFGRFWDVAFYEKTL